MKTVTVEDIIKLIKRAGLVRGRADSLVSDVPLDQQGFDSFDRMSLLTELEDAYHVELPNEVARQLKTLDDVVKHLNQNQ